MAQIVGCLATSHSPQLHYPPEQWAGLPFRVNGPLNPKPDIEQELTLDVMTARAARCRTALTDLRRRLAALAPDTLIIVGDDQHENFGDDNCAPFNLFIGPSAIARLRAKHLEVEGEDASVMPAVYNNNQPLAEDLLTRLMDAGFDPSWSRETRFEGGLGHAYARPLHYLMPQPRCQVVAVTVNTFYRPAPSPIRCLDFGRALGAAVRASDKAERVVILGSGGLSHTRIDEALDAGFVQAIEQADWDFMRGLAPDALVEGTSEIRNWIVTAAAAGTRATMIDYVPCYRTAQGIGCAMGFAYW
jgi:hypothetical protein